MNTHAIVGGRITYDVTTPNENTIEFWIKVIGEIPREVVIFTHRNYATININSERKIGVRRANNTYGGSGSVYYGDKVLKENVPYHVAIVFGNDGVRTYINGELDYSYNSIIAGSRQFRMIDFNTSANIAIEFPRFWERKLSQSEIIENYKSGKNLTANTEGLIMYDLFNPETGPKNEVTGATPTVSNLHYYNGGSIIRLYKSFVFTNDEYYKFVPFDSDGNGGWKSVFKDIPSADDFLGEGMNVDFAGVNKEELTNVASLSHSSKVKIRTLKM